MPRSSTSNDFLAQATHGLAGLPGNVWAVVVAIGALYTVDNVVEHWFLAQTPALPIALAIAETVNILSLGAVYFAVMTSIESSVTWRGAVWFVGTTLVLLITMLGFLFAALWLITNAGYLGAMALVLALLVVSVGFPLLTAWPVAQAVRGGFVPPERILRATQGHRWGLIVLSFLTTAVHKIIPAMDTARSLGQTIALAIGNGAVACATIVLLASIGATAWKFALRNDPALVGAG